jgi:hypothetical protein
MLHVSIFFLNFEKNEKTYKEFCSIFLNLGDKLKYIINFIIQNNLHFVKIGTLNA